MAAVFLVLLVPTSAQAATLLLRETAFTEEGLGYGKGDWEDMTELLDTAFGGSENITVVEDFELETLTDYDSVWIDMGDFESELSEDEVDKIQAFIETGGRVVMVGENDLWTTWNNSILGVVNSSVDEETGGTLDTAYDHALTESVSTVNIPTGGTADGGLSLFTSAVATLWGDSENVLIMLDGNTWADTFIGDEDNQRYAQNVANWIAGNVTSESEGSGTSDSSSSSSSGGPDYSGIVSAAEGYCGVLQSTDAQTLLKHSACLKTDGIYSATLKLAANAVTNLSTFVPHVDQARSVTLRVFGAEYEFVPSDTFSVYAGSVTIPSQAGSYPYTLTINYGSTTLSEKGFIVLGDIKGITSTNISRINETFRMVHDRDPLFSEWEYWVKRLLTKEKSDYAQLLGAMQWQQNIAH